MSVAAALIALLVGFGGVLLGALLAGRNDQRARSDGLLVEALNDAVGTIADIAASNMSDPQARARYASALARVALHASPDLVAVWRGFKDHATTETDEGRARLIAAIQAARTHLHHGYVNDDDVRVLLFGAGPVPR